MRVFDGRGDWIRASNALHAFGGTCEKRLQEAKGPAHPPGWLVLTLSPLSLHKKRTRQTTGFSQKYGRGDWIRTSGLYVPNVALYQAEPHLEKSAPKRSLWLRKKDSNPHIQSQSLLCYLYTIPQYLCCNDLQQQDLLYQIIRICQSLLPYFKRKAVFSASGASISWYTEKKKEAFAACRMAR